MLLYWDMQYKVPQNVQREDTIVGPLTLKQLIILAIGGGLAYATYISLSKAYIVSVWLPPTVILGLATLAFAFLKIHNLPFHEFLMNLLEYHILPRKRIWTQGADTPFISSFDKEKMDIEKKKEIKFDKKPQKSLEEITKVLDTHGQINKN
ncbi:PrgI family protein [Candidatus Peregrinibacteria bacterium]|nr:PrgI family protein [Candidatus Peregrinibacteria bacterium]